MDALFATRKKSENILKAEDQDNYGDSLKVSKLTDVEKNSESVVKHCCQRLYTARDRICCHVFCVRGTLHDCCLSIYIQFCKVYVFGIQYHTDLDITRLQVELMSGCRGMHG